MLCHKIGVSYEHNSDYDLSLKWLERAQRALPPRQSSQAAQIYVSKSVALFRKGLNEDAIRWGRLGLTLCRRSGDAGQLAYAHTMLGSSYRATGRMTLALRHRQSAVRIVNELGDVVGQFVANNNLGGSYLYMGELEKALMHYQVGLAACLRLGDPRRAAIAYNNIGEALLIQGRIDEAAEYFLKVVETYEKKGAPLFITGLAHVNLSRVYQRRQRYREALDQLPRGVALLRKAGARGLLPEAQVQEADLRLDMGEVEIAEHLCQRALKETRELGTKLIECRALRTLGRIATTQGRYAQAEASLQRSIHLAQQLKADYDKALSLMYLADLCVKWGPEESRSRRCKLSIAQTIAIFQRIGATGDLAKTIELQNIMITRTSNTVT